VHRSHRQHLVDEGQHHQPVQDGDARERNEADGCRDREWDVAQPEEQDAARQSPATVTVRRSESMCSTGPMRTSMPLRASRASGRRIASGVRVPVINHRSEGANMWSGSRSTSTMRCGAGRRFRNARAVATPPTPPPRITIVFASATAAFSSSPGLMRQNTSVRSAHCTHVVRSSRELRCVMSVSSASAMPLASMHVAQTPISPP